MQLLASWFDFPASLRAIATACFCGFPTAISVFIFALTALFEEPDSSGIMKDYPIISNRPLSDRDERLLALANELREKAWCTAQNGTLYAIKCWSYEVKSSIFRFDIELAEVIFGSMRLPETFTISGDEFLKRGFTLSTEPPKIIDGEPTSPTTIALSTRR